MLIFFNQEQMVMLASLVVVIEEGLTMTTVLTLKD